MAKRAGVSKKTLYRLKHGDPRVSWGAVFRILNILNLIPELNKALNTTNNALGLVLMSKAVAKRIPASANGIEPFHSRNRFPVRP